MPSTDTADLIVLAKEPVPGRVKTRLCPPCTPAEAATLAAAALADTLDAAPRVRRRRVVLALDGRPGAWCPPGVEVVGQGAGSLDRRLTTAWAAATSGPAVLIGMDTPQVTAADLDAALGALADHDAVLGPASDGGWWALGLRRPHPRAFAGRADEPRPTPAPASTPGWRRSGCAPRRCRSAPTSTRGTTPSTVARAAPGGRFAAAVDALLPGLGAPVGAAGVPATGGVA